MTDPAPTPPAAAPIGHLAQAGTLQADRTTRALNSVVATAKLAASGIDAETIGEFSDLQRAVWDRLRTLQDGWATDWKSWWDYSAQIGGANTMSKLVERESNIFAQMGQLIGAQMTDLMTLQENVEVNYAYWLKQKLAEKAG